MKHLVLFSLPALVGLALVGCGHSTSSMQSSAAPAPPTGSEQAQVSDVLGQNPDFVNEDLYQDPQVQAFDASTGFAAIRPLRFWRTIRHVETTFDFDFSAPDSSGRPTRALVTIHRHLTGTFDILAGSPTAGDTTRSLVHKPLDDHWTRKIALVRRSDRGDGIGGRWRLVGTSGVDVRTEGGVTRLQSLRIQAGALDTTVTDPLELHRLRRLMLLPAGTQVTLTATTGSATDVVLFLGHDMRRRFTNNNDGTFSFQFMTGRFLGLRHFGVDALSHGTLFDDSDPYDSNTWILPFVVIPEQAAMPV